MLSKTFSLGRQVSPGNPNSNGRARCNSSSCQGGADEEIFRDVMSYGLVTTDADALSRLLDPEDGGNKFVINAIIYHSTRR